MNAEIPTDRAKNIAILFAGILSISTAAIFIRFAQQEAPSLVIAAGRMVISAIPLIPVILIWHRQAIKTISKRDMFLSVLSGILLAFHFISWITSLEFTSIASSVVLVCTTPIWVTLYSVIVNHEKVNRTIFFGILVAFIGGILVAMSEVCQWSISGFHCTLASTMQTKHMNFGNLLAFIGALLAAGYLLIGRSVRRSVELGPYTLIVYTTAALTLITILIVARIPVETYTPKIYIFILILALIPQLIGHSTLNWALKYLSTTYVAVAQMGEPVGSTILAILLFKEIPTPIKALGAVLIITGIFIVSSTSAQKIQS